MSRKLPVSYEVTATKQMYFGSKAIDQSVKAVIADFKEGDMSRDEQVSEVIGELGLAVKGFSMRVMRPNEIKELKAQEEKSIAEPIALSNGLTAHSLSFDLAIVEPENDRRRQRVSEWLAGVNAVQAGYFDLFIIEAPEGHQPLFVEPQNVGEVQDRFDMVFGHVYPELFTADQAI